MLTYAINQKNPADKNHYRFTSDVYFTNGSPIEEMEKIFEMKNFGNFLLPNGTKRFFVTTDKGLLIETPFLTESVTLEWYERLVPSGKTKLPKFLSSKICCISVIRLPLVKYTSPIPR
jgi:hypothetical protein